MFKWLVTLFLLLVSNGYKSSMSDSSGWGSTGAESSKASSSSSGSTILVILWY